MPLVIDPLCSGRPARIGLAVLLLAALAGPLAHAQAGETATPKPNMRLSSTLQTGLAENFQLTLGGTFGAGPAWQSRVETGLAHIWKTDDSLYVFGFESLDLPSARSDWQVGVEYRRPLWRSRNHQLAGTAGFQHWKFSNVKNGTNDWLAHENLTYRSKWKALGFLVTSDAWNLMASPLPAGSLLHTQAWMEHPLLKREPVRVTFRHGPAHTYSWDFYGTHGNRVIRYQTMLAVVVRGTRIEGGYRKQFGLQPGIPDNTYWQFSVARTLFSR